MLSEVFWVAFVSTVSGMIIKIASMLYKSKCRECSICCIKVIRDIENEVKEDLALDVKEESKEDK